MPKSKTSPSAKVRAQLKHPVIDSDGHYIEMMPVLEDYIRQVGGADMVKRYQARDQGRRWHHMTLEERRETGTWITPWWVPTTRNTLDRATASLPRLLNERMDELGMDFCVLYPTFGIGMPHAQDDELRRVGCRALNTYLADLYGPYSRRMTPAAAIPMHTPQEAIEELEYATRKLGLKTAVIAGHVRRPIAKLQREHPGLGPFGEDLDLYGLDSPYDYDPFWAKCIELGVAPATHSAGMGLHFRRSLTNYMNNHIGHFAAVGEALCKSLFFGGVTRRFPKLRIALLECGVGWGCDVYAGIIARWEKRNREAVHNMDPALLERSQFMDLVARYGDGRVTSMLEEIRESLDRPQPAPANIDDWALAQVERAEDIRDLFVPHFFFGCEADDPMNAWAFNKKVNPFGAKLNAMLSSDIGHWDVPDMREVVEEAYEQLEKGLITPGDFRDFVFDNPVALYGGMNPDFFKGTAIEAEAARQIRRMNGAKG
jgi:predicted TIM-barrel fold metal-dependent hydrolase